MIAYHWAVLSIQQIITIWGYKIIIITDVPCHLYMRWTTQQPYYHKKSINERGLKMMTDERFCFTVWEDNEQEQAGDTTIHTFIKEPWAFCETRYFYFHGTYAGEPTPSTSGIFNKHRLEPTWGSPEEHIYLPLAHDGYLATWKDNPFIDYTPNWGTSLGTVATTEKALTLFNNNYDNEIHIYRGVLFFDTSDLPTFCKLVSAKVLIWPAVITNPRHATVCLTPATNVHTPLISADYGNLNQTPTIIGTYPMHHMTVGVTFYIDLTSQGLEHLTYDGITRLGLRIDFELEANGSPDSAESFRCRTYEELPVASYPRLYVTYQLPE